MNIAYMTEGIRNIRNTAQYQRSRYLAEKHNLYFFLSTSILIPYDIEDKVNLRRKNVRCALSYFLWKIFAILRKNRSIEFDLVYTFYSPFSIVEGFAYKTLGFKWVADIWDHPERVSEDRTGNSLVTAVKKISGYMAKRVLRYADLVICGILPEALDDYLINKDKILRITNGVELNYTKPSGVRVEDHSVFFVLYVGTGGPMRSIDILVRAINQLRTEIPVRLILAGDFSYESAWLNRYIEENGLSNIIEIRGHIEHEKVLGLIETSDVCVCPLADTKAKRCTYPIKVFEYLAMGKPVVATGLPGISKIVTHEENGLLVPPNDVAGMALAISRLYQDKELKARLEKNARNSVMKYDWDLINDRVDTALRKLVEGGRR